MNWIQKIVVKIILNKEGVKKVLKTIQDFLSGRKTYLVLIISILGTLLAWSQGTMDTMKAIEAIIAAITGMTMRAAITKSGPPTPPTT